MEALVAIYVVTYRRPQLLERALLSLVAQTEHDWVCRVVNDDPADGRVAEVVGKVNDGRIRFFEPVERRGAAANFNLAFRENRCPFSSILEDDNWWEPEFLAEMLTSLRLSPSCELAVGNEKVWREQADGQWKNTGATIWTETEGISTWTTPFEFACGSARLCNSSMVFKTADSSSWQTPDDIPVDVTEHFRERSVPQPILLVQKPLVNYAETLTTNRSTKGSQWGDYQCLLIGSCFLSIHPALRKEYARGLWRQAGIRPSPRSTALLMTAIAIPEAWSLWTTASIAQRIRFLVTFVRRFNGCMASFGVRRRLSGHLGFLRDSLYNQKLAENGSQPREENCVQNG